ncbi:methylated-DNA--[protein]-cysteine S-methyltransferase [Candidatus Bathyarchaeota archaeon]|jgi:O-6-methylguanine DNA methyltransferase|nr:methylated-DNA--[protein]-cysteine S-methyltransferase [Candidatus Bathyarchaeota archaeon]MBT4319731.1 methylated-DNA--[protein]-cysteine S-methyltransferase [Candidatus Bathyarchaeota archaeon]MBT4423888.1 methylated-DNA--[protein]-cysteine S-methyltransferase [Candidatus Bathyarchaeota archaeon]MBT6605116.1 methylated-DNA--[protein]-cysteine S-methyltransferase [Candidatus Bathyarchaeota archaeon]MBT7186553.1 methylated-DNA--[protein]-cysteine S-methyltransferase [Candidatus Bathyarchaeot
MEKIFYSNIESPIGSIWVARSKIGLLRLDFPCEEVKFLKELGAHTETEPEYRPSKLDDIGNWLDGYFKGEKMEYKEPFDLRGTDFQKKVWNAIFDIPHGKLASYGQLAENIKKPKASRAVGNAVGQNPIAIIIPCHRVVWSSGGIGGFGGGLPIKRVLLNIENILPEAEGTPEKGIDLKKFF